MLFSDLDVGDVFVLKWWLDTGPALRHYLVVKRTGSLLHILRLEHDDHKLLELEPATFDEIVTNRELFLIAIYKAGKSLQP